jgi:hypothetical protein
MIIGSYSAELRKELAKFRKALCADFAILRGSFA